MSKTPSTLETARTFCRNYLGRDCFAPFGGQDSSAWSAFVHLIEMWGRADHNGREAAILAMRATLSGIQNKECVHQVFVQTIPAILDWEHVHAIWAQLLAGSPGSLHRGTNWNLRAITQPTEEYRRRVEREQQRGRARP